MKINPVLKNESKLATRSIKFTLVLLFYVGFLSLLSIVIFESSINSSYSSGLNLQRIPEIYTELAIIQAVLLLFIVPSLASTAICGEREKQTLDVLLSTRMSPLSIVLGKLGASVSRVILLIICSMPIYSITLLIGGISLKNIIELSIFFIITTIFVGSLGVFISTIIKTSRASTVIRYFSVLFIFIGIIVITMVYMTFKEMSNTSYADIKIPILSFISPTLGFISLLAKQLGQDSYMFGSALEELAPNGYIISIIFQLILSILFIKLSAYKLNPLNKKKKR